MTPPSPRFGPNPHVSELSNRQSVETPLKKNYYPKHVFLWGKTHAVWAAGHFQNLVTFKKNWKICSPPKQKAETLKITILQQFLTAWGLSLPKIVFEKRIKGLRLNNFDLAPINIITTSLLQNTSSSTWQPQPHTALQIRSPKSGQNLDAALCSHLLEPTKFTQDFSAAISPFYLSHGPWSNRFVNEGMGCVGVSPARCPLQLCFFQIVIRNINGWELWRQKQGKNWIWRRNDAKDKPAFLPAEANTHKPCTFDLPFKKMKRPMKRDTNTAAREKVLLTHCVGHSIGFPRGAPKSGCFLTDRVWVIV